KRRYRMYRLYYACESYAQGLMTKQKLEQRLRDYDEILYEWNDKMNLNLALVGTYFGKIAHTYLSATYVDYRDTGMEFEDEYRTVSQNRKIKFHFPKLLNRIEHLNGRTYHLAAFM